MREWGRYALSRRMRTQGRCCMLVRGSLRYQSRSSTEKNCGVKEALMGFVRPTSILAVALISSSISLVSAGVMRSPLLKPAAISSGTTAIALEDVDGDGDRDALIGNGGQNRLYMNDGSGVFTDV